MKGKRHNFYGSFQLPDNHRLEVHTLHVMRNHKRLRYTPAQSNDPSSCNTLEHETVRPSASILSRSRSRKCQYDEGKAARVCKKTMRQGC